MKNDFFTSDIPVLLIGFNRPLKILERLRELANSECKIPRIFVSIDGPRVNNQSDIQSISEISTIIKQYEKLLPIYHTARHVNLGVDIHVPLAISEVFENYNFCIIIEDDVSISPVFYESMCLAIKNFLNKDKVYVIGSYSIFEKNSSLLSHLMMKKRNYWRISPYFFTWGFATSKEFWNLHKNNNKLSFSESKTWNNLPKRKQDVWLSRFRRSPWDFDVQKSLFLNNGFSLVPLYRISANMGMGDPLSTHSRFPKPWYIFGHGYSHELPVGKIQNSALWNFIDSNTLAGDGYFSTRARTSGVRTLLKRLLRLTLNK